MTHWICDLFFSVSRILCQRQTITYGWILRGKTTDWCHHNYSIEWSSYSPYFHIYIQSVSWDSQFRDYLSDCLDLLHISGHSEHLQNLEIFDVQKRSDARRSNIGYHLPNYKFSNLTKLSITESLGHGITFVRQLRSVKKSHACSLRNINQLTDCYLEILILKPAPHSITHLSLKGCPKLHLPIMQSLTLKSLTLTHYCSDLRGFGNISFCPKIQCSGI